MARLIKFSSFTGVLAIYLLLAQGIYSLNWRAFTHTSTEYKARGERSGSIGLASSFGSTQASTTTFVSLNIDNFTSISAKAKAVPHSVINSALGGYFEYYTAGHAASSFPDFIQELERKITSAPATDLLSKVVAVKAVFIDQRVVVHLYLSEFNQSNSPSLHDLNSLSKSLMKMFPCVPADYIDKIADKWSFISQYVIDNEIPIISPNPTNPSAIVQQGSVGTSGITEPAKDVSQDSEEEPDTDVGNLRNEKSNKSKPRAVSKKVKEREKRLKIEEAEKKKAEKLRRAEEEKIRTRQEQSDRDRLIRQEKLEAEKLAREEEQKRRDAELEQKRVAAKLEQQRVQTELQQSRTEAKAVLSVEEPSPCETKGKKSKGGQVKVQNTSTLKGKTNAKPVAPQSDVAAVQRQREKEMLDAAANRKLEEEREREHLAAEQRKREEAEEKRLKKLKEDAEAERLRKARAESDLQRAQELASRQSQRTTNSTAGPPKVKLSFKERQALAQKMHIENTRESLTRQNVKAVVNPLTQSISPSNARVSISPSSKPLASISPSDSEESESHSVESSPAVKLTLQQNSASTISPTLDAAIAEIVLERGIAKSKLIPFVLLSLELELSQDSILKMLNEKPVEFFERYTNTKTPEKQLVTPKRIDPETKADLDSLASHDCLSTGTSNILKRNPAKFEPEQDVEAVIGANGRIVPANSLPLEIFSPGSSTSSHRIMPIGSPLDQSNSGSFSFESSRLAPGNPGPSFEERLRFGFGSSEYGSNGPPGLPSTPSRFGQFGATSEQPNSMYTDPLGGEFFGSGNGLDLSGLGLGSSRLFNDDLTLSGLGTESADRLGSGSLSGLFGFSNAGTSFSSSLSPQNRLGSHGPFGSSSLDAPLDQRYAPPESFFGSQPYSPSQLPQQYLPQYQSFQQSSPPSSLHENPRPQYQGSQQGQHQRQMNPNPRGPPQYQQHSLPSSNPPFTQGYGVPPQHSVYQNPNQFSSHQTPQYPPGGQRPGQYPQGSRSSQYPPGPRPGQYPPGPPSNW